MGSSTKKKKEKQKDFQKPKLRVGKAKAKASTFTDTSFRAKSIVVNQQSLSETAPDPAVQFRHNLSLAATSRSDTQRRDALAYLTGQLASCSRSSENSHSSGNNSSNNPVGTVGVLNKLLPLLSDPAGPVRGQLLKLFRVLPPAEVRPAAGRILLYVRAGITHLSAAVRDDALSAFEWLLDVAGDELVACPGGWLKTLNGFGAMMGWVASPGPSSGGGGGGGGTQANDGTAAVALSSSGWSAAPKTSFAGSSTALQTRGSGGANTTGQAFARQVAALTKFLELGLRRTEPAPYDPQGYWANLYERPTTANPFGHLNLFGAPRDEDSEMYADREARQRVFAKRWQAAVGKGIEAARREGGAVGRAAATLDEVLQAGMSDYGLEQTVR